MKTKNPMQPLVIDDDGVIRFKENGIVSYLLENGGLDLHKLAIQGGFSKDDWTQFNQLVGYSVSGYGDLSSVSKKAVRKADRKAAKMSLF